MNNYDIEDDVIIFTAKFIENGDSYDRCEQVLRSHHKLPEHTIASIRKIMDSHIWLLDNRYEEYANEVRAILPPGYSNEKVK